MCYLCGQKTDNSLRKEWIGTWKTTAIATTDESAKIEDIGLTMILDQNGQGIIKNQDATKRIRWKRTKTGIKTRGDTILEFTAQDHTLVTKINDTDIILEKTKN